MSEFKVGKINKKIIHSDILNRDVTLSVYLPEDYTNLFKYQLIFALMV
ncbi:enterochelin esterase-like enzyme [Staphylococcus epidermidis]